MKKRWLFFALAFLIVLSGCKKKKTEEIKDIKENTEQSGEVSDNTNDTEKTDNKDDSDNQDISQETVDGQAKVVNNGEYFVKVGTKVYFIKPAKTSLDATRLWGHYLTEDHNGDGNELMCYDTESSEQAKVAGEALGNGKIAYYDGCFYGAAVTKESFKPYIYCVDLSTGKAEYVADGEIEYIDCETGRYVIRYETSQGGNYAVYEGKNQIGHAKVDMKYAFCEAFLKGDYLIYRTSDFSDDTSVNRFHAYNVKTDTDVFLGEQYDTDLEYVDYCTFREADIKESGEVYIAVDYYAGTGHMLQKTTVLCADVSKEGSLKTEEDSTIIESYAAESDEVDTTYDDVLGISYEGDSRNIIEVCENLDDDIFAIVNTAHYNSEESIGWRDAYTIDSMNFYKVSGIEKETITSEIQFPENEKVGVIKTYIVENPNDWAYTKSDIDTDTFAQPLKLKEVKRAANEIIDEDKWFTDNNLWEMKNTVYGDCSFALRDEFDSYSNTGYIVDVFDKNTGDRMCSLDLTQFYNPVHVVSDTTGLDDGWRAEFRYAIAEDNIAYIAMSHRTYSETMLYHAYILAVDLNDGSLLWKSKPLTCNTFNFAIIDDVIVSGYGFTAEPDFIYQISRNNGFILDYILVKTGPDWIFYKENEGKLYVRTYNTDYEYEVSK